MILICFVTTNYFTKTFNKLSKFQTDDYNLQKINMKKNLLFCYYQSLINTIIVIMYFTKYYDVLSIGSLVALINLVTILLQPLLNICSEISTFSNFNLIRKRLKNIEENIE